MARMIADTISSRRGEQEDREERDVIEVFSSPAFPTFLLKSSFFSAFGNSNFLWRL
jgi:hypothetical protein